MPLPLIAISVVLALPVLASGVFIVALIHALVTDRRTGQGAPRWAPDPAFDPALRDDARWAGIEEEWHQFVDSFGVSEVQR